jgi:hypothetical protein
MADIIDGVPIRMGGKDFTVPPLNFKLVRSLRAKLVEISFIKSTPTDAQIDIIVDVVLSALKRNYPDMKAADLDDLLDLGNTSQVLRAIMGAAGFEENAEKLTARA